MSSPKLGDWCAHVTYNDGNIREVIIESTSGNKHLALNKVLKKLDLSGVSDPAIRGINIKEISVPNSKTHKYGDAVVKPETAKPVVVLSHEKTPTYREYQVRLYVSPQVSTQREFNFTAADPLAALNAAAKAAGVKLLSELGPYCVLERQHKQDPNGIKYHVMVTRIIKGSGSFPGVGPVMTGGSYSQPPIIPDRPKVSSAPAVVPANKARDTFVSDVIDILSKETKATQKKYTIKQD